METKMEKKPRLSGQALLEELAEIDAAYADGEITPEQEKRGLEIMTLANAATELLAALKLCERALQERDAEAEEFAAKNAAWIIAKATGGGVCTARRCPGAMDGAA